MSPTSINVILQTSFFVQVFQVVPFSRSFRLLERVRSSCLRQKSTIFPRIFPRRTDLKFKMAELAWKLGSNWREFISTVANAIGDPCEADVQCRVTFAPYSECRQNICQCSDGSHYVEGRCYESVGECTLLPFLKSRRHLVSPATIISPPSWKRFIGSSKMYFPCNMLLIF